jgi:hypothetical protein
VLAWCVAGLLAAAVGVAGRWILRRTDALGRPRRFPAASLVLLVVPAGVMAVPVWHHEQLQQRLGQVASRLAGRDVDVHCQTLGEQFVHAGTELGWVGFDADGHPDDSTVITREPCGDLQSYLDQRGKLPTSGEVIAVHVLTHESRHLAGTQDEARTECEAVQRDAETARLLGASAADAHRLARMYWAVDYPNMPTDYRSADCSPGGRWDEHLPDAPWNP